MPRKLRWHLPEKSIQNVRLLLKDVRTSNNEQDSYTQVYFCIWPSEAFTRQKESGTNKTQLPGVRKVLIPPKKSLCTPEWTKDIVWRCDAQLLFGT